MSIRKSLELSLSEFLQVLRDAASQENVSYECWPSLVVNRYNLDVTHDGCEHMYETPDLDTLDKKEVSDFMADLYEFAQSRKKVMNNGNEHSPGWIAQEELPKPSFQPKKENVINNVPAPNPVQVLILIANGRSWQATVIDRNLSDEPYILKEVIRQLDERLERMIQIRDKT